MAGDMEALLFKGDDDSSSGESDSEAQTTRPSISNNSDTKMATNGPAVAHSAINTSAMSQSERLKIMYSPASKSGGSASQSIAPSPKSIPTHSSLTGPVTAQQIPQAPPNVSNLATNYRSSSSGDAAQQQQLHRSGVPHQGQRSTISAPQQLQQRPGVGIPHQQQSIPVQSNTSHHLEQQQSRTLVHQMQAPSIPHRPSGRLPHQQQNNRLGVHGQQQVTNSHSIRNTVATVPSQALQQNPSSRSGGYVTSSSSSSSSQQQQQQPANDRAMMEKKQKERFLVFTKVLMKYLEQKDPPLHTQVKTIIKDCAERNRNKEPGFESVTAAMRTQLRRVVNDVYWKKAEDYLRHFLKDKAPKPGPAATGSGIYNASLSVAPTKNNSSNAQDDVNRSNEMQLQPLQRIQDTQRVQNQDLSKANVPAIRTEPSKKRQTVPNAAAPTKSTTNSAKAAQSFPATKESSAPKSRAKGSSTPTQQRKQSLPPGTSNSIPSLPVPVPQAVAPPAPAPAPLAIVREYNELMEHVDHAVAFDWTAAGSLLGDSTLQTINEEQKRLIYDLKNVALQTDTCSDADAVCFPFEGWSHRNIVSARVAWSRLRLGRKQAVSDSAPSNPLVAGGLLGMSQVLGKKPVIIENIYGPDPIEVDTAWYNENKAEADITLAVLSEGAEIYLKSVLIKALHCARQRQNLDGIRLWHQQISQEDGQPVLSLRLGCDVERQIALEEGNVAMTCKRMEQVINRQSMVDPQDLVLDAFTLENANSMSDLSLKLPLGKAEMTADLEGKRKFEIYGGKNFEEPPLGRLIKHAKLDVIDFQAGMALSRRGRRHQAATSSSSFFF